MRREEELLVIKSLSPELQYRIWARERRRTEIHDWVCALACAAMAATIAIKPLNEWLDRLIPIGSAPANKAQVSVPAKPAQPISEWTKPVKAGDALGKGLVAGRRGFDPRGLINPVTGKLSPHWGWDVGAPYGLPLYTVTQGKGATVQCLYQPHGAGYYAVITPDSPRNVAFVTMHMGPGTCKPGWHPRGSVIGNVASTGNSTGPHIHFEFHEKGVRKPPGRKQLEQHINGF